MMTQEVPLTAVQALAEFLATGPKAEEILAFRLPPVVIDRNRVLIAKLREGELSREERHELTSCECADLLMQLTWAKIRATRVPQSGGVKKEIK